MAVTPNTIVTADVVTSLDLEFNSNFEKEIYDFIGRLGLEEPMVMAAGTTLYKLTVTGALNNSATAGTPSPSSSGTAYVEGDEVALSHYAVTKTPVGELGFKPYRKRTTAAAIQKGGYEQAVLRTDKEMLNNLRTQLLNEFFTDLTTTSGASTATGQGMQKALANMDAKMNDLLETKGFSVGRCIRFVNPYDIAGYLGAANVGLATLYGMNYLQNFLGVTDIVVTNKVTQGDIWMTPVENIRFFAADFSELSRGGLTYTISDHGIIGVTHEANLARVSTETHVLSALTMMTEYADLVVHGTITA